MNARCASSGFSTHYNVSFDVPAGEAANGRTVERLAYLLTHVLAAPVMLLAANRRSTGIGVRPRGDRIEVTADFTPDAALMVGDGDAHRRHRPRGDDVAELRAWRARAPRHPGRAGVPPGSPQLAAGMGGSPGMLPATIRSRATSTRTCGGPRRASDCRSGRWRDARRARSGGRSARSAIRCRSSSSPR